MAARGKPFQKGNKASVGHGRPPGSSYVDICRKWADSKGWDRLINWAEGQGYKAGLKDGKFIEIGPDMDLQFQAAKTLIEYGYGKPKQAMEHSGIDSARLIFVRSEKVK